MDNVLLVDANNIGYTAQHKRPIVHDGVEVQAFIWSLTIMRQVMSQVPEDLRVIMLWDGYPKYRKELYPDYKGQRDNNPKLVEAKKKYKNVVKDLAKAYHYIGFEQVRGDNCEADDLAGYYCRELYGCVDHVYLLTGDRDWWQLVHDYVSVVDIKSRKRITIRNFEKHTGYKDPREFLAAKKLIGDTSDNIKGIHGIGEKRAKEIINRFGTVTNFIFEVRSGVLRRDDLPKYMGKFYDQLIANKDGVYETLDTNEQLMNLIDHEVKVLRDVKFKRSEPKEMNEDKLVDVMLDVGCVSIADNMENWLKPFKQRLKICR